MNSSRSRSLLLASGIVEAILAIPILGGSLILLTGYTLLVITLALHIVTLVFCSQEKKSITGSIVGIITSVLGWIPFIGWALHLTSAIILLVAASRKDEPPYPQQYPPAPGSF